jgi:protein-tyrosine phosphatase
MYKFAAASPLESIVFGAARPGYTEREIYEWIEFMQQQNIQQICCLLTNIQLFSVGNSLKSSNPNLLNIYRQRFGEDRVCWAPIRDFHLCELTMLTQQILPVLKTAERQEQKVVVHCTGGIGRTGHILAAWLVYRYQYSNQKAISTVIKMGRNPYEAAIFGIFRGKNLWDSIAELNLLLDRCRSPFTD